MTRFVINNGYINKSIQKTGIPGFSGCTEHTTMLWDRIKTAQNKKSAESQVIRFDLENSDGSVRLLEKAMEFFWIPEVIKNLISAYLAKVEYKHYDGMCHLSTTFRYDDDIA